MPSAPPLRQRFDAAKARLPLVAVLRGIRPAEAAPIAAVLHAAGFRLIEVPLNSPEPCASIAAMRAALPGDTLVGAGTVLAVAEVEEVRRSGAEMVFSPNTNADVIRAAKAAGLLCVPGVATPSEAFAALHAGADGLKLFPAGDLVTPGAAKAMRAVLPRDTLLLPFGGITTDNMKPWVDVGVRAFGIGASLYKPGMSSEEVGRRAGAFAAAWAAVAPA